MPALKKERFHHKAKNGEERSLECPVYVDVDGVFHVTFEDDLESCIEESLIVGTNRTEGRNGQQRVSGNKLDDCKRVVGEALKMWMQCEVTEEVVIRYGQRCKVTYWKMPDGAIYANGYDAKQNDPNYDHGGEIVPGINASDKNGDWHGELNATTQAPGYSVELVAVVARKVTFQRGDVTEIEYHRPDYPNFSCKTYGERLDDFVGLRVTDGYWNSAIELTDMPYTEEAAKFFYDMLIGMCSFADKIEAFFGEPENVTNAIEAGSVPLLEMKS